MLLGFPRKKFRMPPGSFGLCQVVAKLFGKFGKSGSDDGARMS